MENLIVLGTGTALVTRYYNTCYAIYDGENYFLTDGGGGDGIYRQFKEAGISWNRVHHIFVSHEHTDHLLGIICAIRMITYRMSQDKYEGVLHLYAHPELLEKIRTICSLTLRAVEQKLMKERIHWIPVADGEQKTIMGYQVTFFDLCSTKAKQFGYRMQLKCGKALTFLGDEPCNESREGYAENADWLLSEAFCLYSQREIFHPYEYHHSTVKDACTLAEKRQVKNLVLWHTEDQTYGQRQEKYLEEGRGFYHGNLYIPNDLDVIRLDAL